MKLVWFYRPEDFGDLRLDKQVKLHVAGLAPAELVYTDHFTINEAGCIFSKSLVVNFSMERCDLRPLSHNDTFACTTSLVSIGDGKARMQVSTLRVRGEIDLTFRCRASTRFASTRGASKIGCIRLLKTRSDFVRTRFVASGSISGAFGKRKRWTRTPNPTVSTRSSR